MNRDRSTVNQVCRLVEGFSLAASATLIRSGAAAARTVVGETLRAAHGRPDAARLISPWDLVRGFPLDKHTTVEVIGGAYHDGTIAPLERYVLAHLLRYFCPMRVLEVGTFRGGTTRLFLENMPPGAKIWTIDLPLETGSRNYCSLTAPSDERLVRQEVVGIDYRSHPRHGDVTQVLGDTFDATVWADLPDGIEFVFIDASHSYAAVKNDTTCALSKLDPGAVIAWHDYTEGESPDRGVGRFIRELMDSDAGLFILSETDLAIRIPADHLRVAQTRVPTFFDPETYARKYPKGVFTWL